MQFQVPQNVQREDTIIGSVTLRQLIILAIGGGLAYGIYVSLGKTYVQAVALPPALFIGGITAAVAFVKVHGMEFHIYLMSLIQYHYIPKQRYWIQNTGTPFISPFEIEIEKKKEKEKNKKILDNKKLKEISQLVDTYGKISNK